MADGIGNKAGKIFVWILLALLIIGLAGFGIGSFGGSATSVAKVGDRDITAQEYFRSLQSALRAETAARGAPISRPDAEAMGLLAAVQGQLVTTAALDDETASLGISVSDETVAAQIRAEPAFAGPAGGFDRQAYEFALRNAGFGISEFEESVREETARTILQGAVAGGMAAPAPLVDALMAYAGERRSLEWRLFTAADLTEPLPAPSEADLQAQYEATPEAYTLPETKRITYAILRPEAVATTLEADESAVAALYQERIDQYVQPERRLVERLVFPDADAAVTAKTQLDAGEVTFADLVAERNLTLADIDLGDVSREDLGAAAGPIFELTEPGVVGPFATELGPALFRMNAILNAREIPLQEVRDELARELTIERARRMLDDMVPDLDDMLAAGATLEELAAETDMELAEIAYYPGVEADIVGYEVFRNAAEDVTEEDFPEISILVDGSLFALRLDAVDPPALQPLPEVRATVTADWRAAETERRLVSEAERAQAQLAIGAALGDGGASIDRAELITRDAFLDGVPGQMVTRAFALETGQSAVVAGDGAVALVQLTEIAGPDTEDPGVAFLQQALTSQMSQAIASDALELYARSLLAEKGITFNEAGLNAVHTQVFN